MSPRTLPVTPAERACATVLRAWLEWQPSPEDDASKEARACMFDFGGSLRANDFVTRGQATPAGADLLARVEAAPVPDPTVAIVAFIASEEARYRRNSKDQVHDAAGRERCANKASVLATVAAYIERGDHLTTPIDAPPAKEPT